MLRVYVTVSPCISEAKEQEEHLPGTGSFPSLALSLFTGERASVVEMDLWGERMIVVNGRHRVSGDGCFARSGDGTGDGVRSLEGENTKIV